MASGVRVERVPVPWQGLDDSASDPYMRSPRGLICDNVLSGVGRLMIRGPFVRNSQSLPSSPTQAGVLGYLPYKSGATVGYVDHTGTPKVAYGGLTWTAMAAASGQTPCSRGVTLGDYSYARSYNNTVVRTSATSTGTVPTEITTGPLAVTAVTAHIERVFAAVYPNSGGDAQLQWTDPGGPTTNVATEWQDDVSGLTNLVTLTNDPTPILTMVSLNNQLVIFKRASIWVLNGGAPSQFVLRRVADVGIAHARAWCQRNGIIYFIAPAGTLMSFDGSELRTVSSAIQRTVNRIFSAIFLSGSLPSLGSDTITEQMKVPIELVYMGNNHLMLTIGGWNVSTTPFQAYMCAMYNLDTDAWTTATTSLTQATAPLDRVDVPIAFAGVGAGRGPVNFIYSANIPRSFYSRPPEDNVPIAFDGKQFFNIDLISGTNSELLLCNGIDMVFDPSSSLNATAVPVNGHVRYKPPRTASPAAISHMESAYLEYAAEYDSAHMPGWQLNLLDLAGGTIYASTQLPAATTAEQKIVYRTRAGLDVRHEVDTPVVDVTFTGGEATTFAFASEHHPAECRLAELYDAWVAYEVAREYRNP